MTGVSGSQSRTFSYDTRGNVTHNGLRSSQHFLYLPQIGTVIQLNFNLANQLMASGALSYQYDGHNRLVKRSQNGSTSYHLYSQSGKLLYERAASGEHTEHVYLGSQLVAKQKGNVRSYVHSDLLGSPRLETNSSRVIQSNSRQHYQPYGQRIPSSNYTDIGFTGHKHDGELGLTYMQQRYYDPVVGRFYSNDPVDTVEHMELGNLVQGFNRYAYANNNPYKYIDPDGEFIHLIIRGAQIAHSAYKAHKIAKAAQKTDRAIREITKGATEVGKKGGTRHYKKESLSPRSEALKDQKTIPGGKPSSHPNKPDTITNKTSEGGSSNVHTSSGNKGTDSTAGNTKLEIVRPAGKSDIKVEYIEKSQ